MVRCAFRTADRSSAAAAPAGRRTAAVLRRSSSTAAAPSAPLRWATAALLRSLVLVGEEEVGRWQLPLPQAAAAATILRSLVLAEGEEVRRRQLPLRRSSHPFYIAPLAEYTLLLGLGLAGLLASAVVYFSAGTLGPAAAPALAAVALAGLRWIRDMEALGSSAAVYTAVVRRNLVVGVLLFIVSEVMVFFGLFWAYFHSSLNPAPELGAVWPPAGLAVLEWFRWPTLSTALLLYSGATANSFFYGLKVADPRPALAGLPEGRRSGAQWRAPLGAEALRQSWLLFGAPAAAAAAAPAAAATPAAAGRTLRRRRLAALLAVVYGGLVYTVAAGALFLRCQAHEYGHATFAMADGVYGSVFYGLTGLHGLHVAAGLGLLLLTLGRLWAGRLVASSSPHCGAAATVWYWHFVDLVWIFLYLIVYGWGSAGSSSLAAEAAAATVGHLWRPCFS